MRRKFWIIISILTALISGMFLYEGGKIFFWFRDRRGGLTVLIAGILVLVLFVRGVWRSIRLDEEYISREETDSNTAEVRLYDDMAATEAKEAGVIGFLISDLSLGCGVAGIVLYLTRFWPVLLNFTAAGVVLGAALLVAVTAVLIKSGT